MALAHPVGDKVETAYRRDDLFEKRRQLEEAWARYCDGEEPTESKVVRLAGRGLRGRAAKLAENRPCWWNWARVPSGRLVNQSNARMSTQRTLWSRGLDHSSGIPALRRPAK